MRLTITLFITLLYSNIFAQSIKHIEWVRINAVRKDGSKIIDRLATAKDPLKYYFEDDFSTMTINHQFSLRQKYSVDNSQLSIGDFLNYNIDLLTDTILAISEFSNNEIPDSKLNSFIFLNNKYLFEYLNGSNQLTLIGDSLIVCNNKFSPSYNGNINKPFKEIFKDLEVSKIINGSFIIDKEGNISEIVFEKTKQFSNNEISKITNVINDTKYKWTLPYIEETFKLKIKFAIEIGYFKPMLGIHFILYPHDINKTQNLSTQNIELVDFHFNNGLRKVKKGKYESAASEFLKCIEIDNLCLDAYYNLALVYENLGKMNLACEYWKKLKDLGQKEGEMLFEKNCQR